MIHLWPNLVVVDSLWLINIPIFDILNANQGGNFGSGIPWHTAFH